MRGRGTILTAPQRAELIRVYVHGGAADARALALEYGVSANYPADLARRAGVYRRPTLHHVIKSKNRMWVRAVAIGPVIA